MGAEIREMTVRAAVSEEVRALEVRTAAAEERVKWTMDKGIRDVVGQPLPGRRVRSAEDPAQLFPGAGEKKDRIRVEHRRRQEAPIGTMGPSEKEGRQSYKV